MHPIGVISSRQARFRQTFRAVVLLALSASYAMSQSASSREVEQITQLEHRRANAVVHGDVDFLDRITATDSVRISPMAELETKSQFLAELKSGRLTYSAINVNELSVRVFDKIAVVVGRSSFEGKRGGKPFRGEARFSRVWANGDGGWQEILFQLTPLPVR